MRTITIYPAGGVKKGNDEREKEKVSWTEEDMELFKQKLMPVKVNFIDPRYRNDSLLKDFTSFFGRDLMAVKVSDFIVVDARQKRGIGVGQEMLFAKMHKIPVISVAPRNSHYIKKAEYLGKEVSNYIHPFLYATSDAIVDDFEKAAEWIRDFLESPKEIKDISVTEKAIEEYMKKYMTDDDPVSRVIKNG